MQRGFFTYFVEDIAVFQDAYASRPSCVFGRRNEPDKAEQVLRDGIAEGDPDARVHLAVFLRNGGAREGRAGVPGRHRRW